jgi:hypothetical protein
MDTRWQIILVIVDSIDAYGHGLENVEKVLTGCFLTPNLH